ncbi:hypothetical protein CK203_007410 [Vitis vinifera]|uniref:Uncharacterized protein n=1 Tax=Vitis vinifera TaxID=29760 RepID=A0A438G0T5_VITVI|nr:hypothetical protein CK203_007410 [Vitis vinifera]
MLDRLPLPRSDLDQEENYLDREEKATGRERKFCATLDRSSTGQGQPIDRFPNRFAMASASGKRSGGRGGSGDGGGGGESGMFSRDVA